MNQYIVNIELPETLPEEFIAKIPKQRKQIDRLFVEGRLYFYSLAYDRTRLWTGVRAESIEEVWNILYTFPLIEYMNAEIHELAFHHSTKNHTIELSLN